MPQSKANLAKEKALKTSLKEAAKILNKSRHTPSEARAMTVTRRRKIGFEVALHQIFCPQQNAVIGLPSTDIEGLTEEMIAHNADTGHNSYIVSSDK
jgi:hypothetical protein